jgi:hypothetical protein
MIQEETVEDLGCEIKADKGHAQILLKMVDPPGSDDEAVKLIEGLGIHVVEKTPLSTSWVLFKLDVKDMRNVALTLTEHGFFIKGINALSEE